MYCFFVIGHFESNDHVYTYSITNRVTQVSYNKFAHHLEA